MEMIELNKIVEAATKEYIEHTAGSSIDSWDATYLPPEEWAAGIFEDAVKNAVLLQNVRRYDSIRKVTVPVKTITAATWESTEVADSRTGGSLTYDATGIILDPVEYRATMPITRKSLEEATWSVEADVRERIRDAVSWKLDSLIWASMDGTSLDGTDDFQTAGESLTNTTTGNAVDYGTALSVDNVIDGIYNVRNTSKNYYVPDVMVVSPAMVKELMKESTFMSAAEWGNTEILQKGVITRFLNLKVLIQGDIPQDSGNTDVGIIFDKKRMFLGNVSHEFELATARRYETDEIEWFVKTKAAFSVGDSEAGSVLYT